MQWVPQSVSSLLLLPVHRRFLGLLQHSYSAVSELSFVQPYIHFPPSRSNRQDLETAWDFDLGSSSSSSSSSSSGEEEEEEGAVCSGGKRRSSKRDRKETDKICLSLHNHLLVKTQQQSIQQLRILQRAPQTAWLSPEEAAKYKPGASSFYLISCLFVLLYYSSCLLLLVYICLSLSLSSLPFIACI